MVAGSIPAPGSEFGHLEATSPADPALGAKLGAKLPKHRIRCLRGLNPANSRLGTKHLNRVPRGLVEVWAGRHCTHLCADQQRLRSPAPGLEFASLRVDSGSVGRTAPGRSREAMPTLASCRHRRRLEPIAGGVRTPRLCPAWRVAVLVSAVTLRSSCAQFDGQLVAKLPTTSLSVRARLPHTPMWRCEQNDSP
jgi:hypothetical protein